MRRLALTACLVAATLAAGTTSSAAAPSVAAPAAQTAPAPATKAPVTVIPAGPIDWGDVPPSCPDCPGGAIVYWPGQASVAIMATPSGQGYWVVDNLGNVYTMGDARFYGEAYAYPLNQPIRAAASTPTGRGYWLFAADGGVFSFGDARFYGSTGDMRLNAPIVTAASTPTGRGYWLFAADGGVFSFGDARFYGSTGNMRLHQPVVTAVASPTGRGYWLFAADGGVFSFGDVRFYGSATHLRGPFVAGTARPQKDGYWLVTERGEVYGFGKAFSDPTDKLSDFEKWGSTRFVAATAHRSGTGLWLARSSGRVDRVAQYPVVSSWDLVCPDPALDGSSVLGLVIDFYPPWDFPKGRFSGPQFPEGANQATPPGPVPSGTGTTVTYWDASYSAWKLDYTIDMEVEMVKIYLVPGDAGKRVSRVRTWAAPNAKNGGKARWIDFELPRTLKVPKCPNGLPPPPG